MRKQRIISLCLASALALSLAACNSPTDEQNSAQPTPSTQPTAAPTPTPSPIPYTDVAEDSPYYDAVVWAYENGIASDGETFGPADACTRGQVMTFLWRAKGSPEPQAAESPFSDVSASDWFYKPALWASENGIATGTAFNPGSPCTNAEALTFLWRAEGKPAASVYDSAVALAASGQYYARPAAWAETNGLFAGADFDPAAACSRADLMTYLYWAGEQWTLSEEDKAVQAEFEQIINDAQLYEVHGSGLVYADYVDMEGDGTVELLTVELGYNKTTATVYMNTNGHVEKYADTSWGMLPGAFSICQSDSKPCLCVVDYQREPLGVTKNYVFWKIGNDGFTFADTISNGADGSYYIDWTGYPRDYEMLTAAEYNAVIEKYKNQKELFLFNSNGLSVKDRGLVPSREEYEAVQAQRWANHWAEIDPAYAAALKGDFSAFAGSYDVPPGWGGDTITMDKNGVLASTDSNIATSQKPISITVTEHGAISCVVKAESTPDGTHEESYEIYPVGIEYEFFTSQMDEPLTTDKSKVRMIYIWRDLGMGWGATIYYKIS